MSTIRLGGPGITSRGHLVDISAFGPDVVVTAYLNPIDSEGVADSLFINQGTYDPAMGFFTPTRLLLSMGGSAEILNQTVLVPDDGPRFLEIDLQSGYTDETSFYDYRVVITDINTLPLVFEELLPDGQPLKASDVFDNALMGESYLLVSHWLGDYGLMSETATIHFSPDFREVMFDPGDYVILQVSDVAAAGVPIRFLADGSGLGPFTTFDNRIIQAEQFELVTPLDLGCAEILPLALRIEERGVVFAFFADLPTEIGGLTLISDMLDPDDPVLDANSRLIGNPVWTNEDLADGTSLEDVLLLDVFRADIGEVTISWDAAREAWRWQGEMVLRDLLGIGSRIAVETIDPYSGFFADASQARMSGSFVSTTTYNLEIYSLGDRYTLSLDNIEVYDNYLYDEALSVLGMEAKVGLQLGRHRVRFDSDMGLELDAANQWGTEAAFGYQTVEALARPPLETGFAGITLTDFDAQLEGLEGGAPTLDVQAAFEIGQGSEGPLLVLATGMYADGPHGLEGVGVLSSYGSLLSLGGVAHFGFNTALGSLSGDIDLDVHVMILGPSLIARVDGDFVQYDGVNSSFDMRGQGEVTSLPGWLADLFGLSEGASVSLVASIAPLSPAESFLDLVAAPGGHADFALRYWFDDRLELLGGQGFGDADLEGGGGGGAAGLFTFTLDTPSERLLLRAEGAVDAAEVVLITPLGTRLALADFLAAGVTVLADDTDGLTLLVTSAAAGTWSLEAADATSFAGFATLPSLTLSVTAITTPDGPGLRAEVTWPAGIPAAGYAFRVFTDDDASGFNGGAMLRIGPDSDGVIEVAFAALGLAPGAHFLHVEAVAEGLAAARAYLAGPVTITDVADLAIQGEFFFAEPILHEDLDPGTAPPAPIPMLGITVTNEGTARALAPLLTFGNTDVSPRRLGDIEPGQTVRLLVNLQDGGVDPGTPYITLDIVNGGHEADLSDNSIQLRPLPLDTPGPKADAVTLPEDNLIEIAVLSNDVEHDTVTLVEGPRHGSVELLYDRLVRYTPDQDFNGTDVFTYAGNGGQAQVWITVTPTRDAPRAVTAIGETTAIVGGPFALAGGAAFMDVDGDVLHFELTTEDGGVPPAWILFDGVTGAITGTPAPGDTGSIILRLTAFDSDFGTQQFFTLNIVAPLRGTEGPDALSGTASHDVILGLGGHDSLRGGSGNDTLLGDAGNDRLEGGLGADSMEGGTGDDTYQVDDWGDLVVELPDAGQDRVITSVSLELAAGVERLSLAGTADLSGTGNALANRLDGNAGANLLDGGEGNDTLYGLGGHDILNGGDGADRLDGGLGADLMQGGAENDTYVVDEALDAVLELADEGYDRVIASINYALGADVERLSLTGTADLTGTGNALANRLEGNAGANALDGGAANDTLYGLGGNDTLIGGDGADRLDGGIGADRMRGGAENDTYVVDEVLDVIVELAGEGYDRVIASLNHALGAHLERLSLIGTADLTGMGNAVANRLDGNAGANALDGGDGNDTLYGLGGNDTLIGGGANDLLDGGADADEMTGGAMTDVFRFVRGQAQGDVITDFMGNGAAAGDRLEFRGYGTTAQGAIFVQSDATTWRVTSADGLTAEVITFANAAVLHSTDWSFV
jgi:Ca2+-binding RTX toxin-like protein